MPTACHQQSLSTAYISSHQGNQQKPVPYHMGSQRQQVARKCSWCHIICRCTPQNELRIGALGQDVQQISRCHKIKARESHTLCLQVVLQTEYHSHTNSQIACSTSSLLTEDGRNAFITQCKDSVLSGTTFPLLLEALLALADMPNLLCAGPALPGQQMAHRLSIRGVYLQCLLTHF